MNTATALLEARGLHVSFAHGHGLGRRRERIRAVSGVSLRIGRGETLALVGESGSGKTTTARAILGLDVADEGTIYLDGVPTDARERKRSADFRRRTQLVFQDPYSSLDPRMRIGEQIIESLEIARSLDRAARRGHAARLLEAVGLEGDHRDRYPHEFSGGQRQRIAIARAISLRPDLVICDEPVSALDVSIQAQIINLLQDLQSELHVSYLLIAHDLGVVRSIAHRVAVMYLGRIVESGSVMATFARPRHPYTLALVSAVPSPRPSIERTRRRIILTGEIPSPAAVPSGCAFRTRCRYAVERCATEVPALRPIDPHDTLVACHRAEEIPGLVAAGVQ